MKQQRLGTGFSPSRICKVLFVLLVFKATIIGVMLFDPVVSGVLELWPFEVQGHSVAHAAEAIGAPPAIPSTTVDGAQITPNTPAVPANRALPAIVNRSEKNNDGSEKRSSDVAEVSLAKDMLSRKQEELARKEQELRILESNLSEKLERMELLELRLQAMIKEAENSNDAKFKHLIDVLSNMKAKSAAQVLETLEARIAVKVLAGMRGRQAGEILTFVKPEIAASLTAALTRMQMPLN